LKQDARGKDVNLNAYRGKVLLVVNVASKWLAQYCFVLFLNGQKKTKLVFSTPLVAN